LSGGSILISRVALKIDCNIYGSPRTPGTGKPTAGSKVHSCPNCCKPKIEIQKRMFFGQPFRGLFSSGTPISSLIRPWFKPFFALDVRVSCLGPIRRTLAVASWRPQPFGGQQQRALRALGSMALGGPRTLKATRGTIRRTPAWQAVQL
jgi:hypothetical protein